MASVGSKTPVAVINEYYINRKITPTYTLVPEKTHNLKAHNPTFTIHIQAGDDFAEGTGASKQQAKQKAAEALLDVLKGRDQVNGDFQSVVETIANPVGNQIGFNAVGDLKDYCEQKNYPGPVFDIIREEGPSHAKIFTCRVSVSSLNEIGISGTKKQAKHQAAFGMLGKLKRMDHEDCLALACPTVPPEEKEASTRKNDEEAIQMYMRLTKQKPHAAQTGTNLATQYLAYYKLMEKSLTLASLNINKALMDNPMETLKIIASDLNAAPCYEEFSCDTDRSQKVVFVEVRISPLLCGAGFTFEEAARSALECLQQLTA